jgi:hypothetical protein
LFFSQVGNHESDYPGTVSNPGFGKDSGGECSVVSLTMMPQPLNYSAIMTPGTSQSSNNHILYNEPWYSYDIGFIHFLSMSSEHNFTIGSKQYLFIENDLKNVNKSITPWILFSGHRPMYVDSDWVCTYCLVLPHKCDDYVYSCNHVVLCTRR